MGELKKETRGNILLKSVWPFGFIHVLPIAAIWTDVTSFDWILCGAMYVIRMFFITGGYHRYFAHKTYKTSRVGQFIIAFMAQTSVQKGALWWAAHHRIHHKTSDTVEDPHSMKVYGFGIHIWVGF
ncbi:MAG: hypothetical protein HRT72_05005 [Flavobacteriales bacterium]|nr:hypothetical protein [Flavobacteriales bacterium]